MVTQPETRYAKSDAVNIAYQVTGTGSFDLVWVPGFISHLEADWDSPAKVRQIERFGSFCRLIRFDKRGTGLSDRVAVPTLEQRMDDVRAVMDAAGSKQAVLLGFSEGGPMSLLFAATYPERTSALVMYGSYARRLWAPDYPYGQNAVERDEFVRRIEREWGGPVGMDMYCPSIANDPIAQKLWAQYLRQAASPGAAVSILRMNDQIDVRHVLPAIRVPTLVVHRIGDRASTIEQARHLAKHIPGARLVEFPGDDHLLTVGDSDPIVDEIERFLTGFRGGAEADRVLATILFTDIVGSTERMAQSGDSSWRQLLGQHHALVRREISKFRGREIDTAGDGFLAAFDGPARAVRCAHAIQHAASTQLNLDLRAGVHAGECELLEDKLAGLAVHIGARVAALANAGEVLVSSTVKDLVAGSGLQFENRGNHVLKGIPGEWRLFSSMSPN